MNNAEPKRSAHMRAIFSLLVTITMWAVGPLFVRHFTGYYNLWTQNAFRYMCAATILLALGAWRGHLRYPLTARQRKKLLLVIGANILMQTNFAAMYYFIYPAVASLVTRLNIVFVTFLSFLIFKDERRVIKSPHFAGGAVMALVGAGLVVVGRDPELLALLNVTEHDFWIGVGLAVVFAFFQSVYALTIRHAVSDIPALVSFTHVSWTTALGLCVLMLVAGGVQDLWHQPALPLALMALSALLSIVIAHAFYYKALQHLKASVSTSMLQLTPIITCFLSALIYDEILTTTQITGGAAVICGAWLAAVAQAKTEE